MNISKREYQVTELIAWGASDKEVAQELNISMLTARTHRRNIEQKIEAHNTADVTRWFFQEKCSVSFGMSPRIIKHIAMIFLLIVGYAEYSNSPVVRTLSARKANAGTQRVFGVRVRVRRNEYVLA